MAFNANIFSQLTITQYIFADTFCAGFYSNRKEKKNRQNFIYSLPYLSLHRFARRHYMGNFCIELNPVTEGIRKLRVKVIYTRTSDMADGIPSHEIHTCSTLLC